MKLKTVLLGLACAALLSTPAQAVINLSISFTPVSSNGGDTNGFIGSTWNFVMTSSQTEYVNVSGLTAVVSDSVTLTISGAGNPGYNGSYPLVETNTTNFTAFPSYFNTQYFLNTTTGAASTFNFGSPVLTVSGVSGFGPDVVSSQPWPGDPIEASDFEGALLSAINILIEGEVYDFGSGTMGAAVPEPSTYAALFGLAALGVAALRRQRKAT